jgi:hypothetical protein
MVAMKRDEIYNQIVSAFFSLLWDKSRETHGVIALDNFDTKNEEHLFLFEVAKAVCSCTDRELQLNLNWFKRRKLWRPVRKSFTMFKKPTEQTIDTVELLNQLRNTCESLIGEDFKYSDIYNEFYKVKK